MQTERVTFLTTPDHKAALDAFASANGHSVGHVLREASSHFIASSSADSERETELAAVTSELEAALPQMREDVAVSLDLLREMNAMMETHRVERARRKAA